MSEGQVIRTDPPAGTDAAKGSTVTIVISDGPEQVTVPDVEGKTEAEAKEILTGDGFKVSVAHTSTPLDNSDDGTVVDQNPNGGTKADKGSTVTITIAD